MLSLRFVCGGPSRFARCLALLSAALLLSACGGEGNEGDGNGLNNPQAVLTAVARAFLGTTEVVLVERGDVLRLEASDSTGSGSLEYAWRQTHPVGAPDIGAAAQGEVFSVSSGVDFTVPADAAIDGLEFEVTVTETVGTQSGGTQTNTDTAVLRLNVVLNSAADAAFFVDQASGTDSASCGDRDDPCQTLPGVLNIVTGATSNRAIYMAAAFDGTRCEDDDASGYRGNVTIDAPISIFGGFDADWQRDPAACKTTIVGLDGGPVLDFTDLFDTLTLSGVDLRTKIPRSTTGQPELGAGRSAERAEFFGLRLSSSTGEGDVTIDDSRIEVEDWDASVGPASVGVFAHGIANLTLVNSEIETGNGGLGADGADASPVPDGPAAGGAMGDAGTNAAYNLLATSAVSVAPTVVGGVASCSTGGIPGTDGGRGGGGEFLSAAFIDERRTLSAPPAPEQDVLDTLGFAFFRRLFDGSDLLGRGDASRSGETPFLNRRAGAPTDPGAEPSCDRAPELPVVVRGLTSAVVGAGGFDGCGMRPDGADGPDGVDLAAAGSPFTLSVDSATGRVEARGRDGGDGEDGIPGQGGGGGSAALVAALPPGTVPVGLVQASGGGGGGAGGCAGEGGLGGRGGAGSIGVVLSDVPTSTIRCNTIVTGQAGLGGDGGAGGDGQEGGGGGSGSAPVDVIFGLAVGSAAGGDGGDGGDGSAGGNAGDGDRGPKVAVALANMAPGAQIAFEDNFIGLGGAPAPNTAAPRGAELFLGFDSTSSEANTTTNAGSSTGDPDRDNLLAGLGRPRPPTCPAR